MTTGHPRDVEQAVIDDLHRRATPEQTDWLRLHTDQWHAEVLRLITNVEGQLARSDARMAEGEALSPDHHEWRERATGFLSHLHAKAAEVEALRADRALTLETAIHEVLPHLRAASEVPAAKYATAVLEKALT